MRAPAAAMSFRFGFVGGCLRVFGGRQPIGIQRRSGVARRRSGVDVGPRRPTAGSGIRIAVGYAGLGTLTGNGDGGGPARYRPVLDRRARPRGGSRRATGCGAVGARLNPSPVAIAACGDAGQFDCGPMAAADLVQAVGGGAGAPFPVHGDIATPIADADAHVAPPGADRVRYGSARQHLGGSRYARKKPNRSLSIIRSAPIWPIECWFAEVQGGMKRKHEHLTKRGCCRGVHLPHPARKFATSSACGPCPRGGAEGGRSSPRPAADPARPHRVGARLRKPFDGHWRAHRGEYRIR